jgi:hypothetical protein
VGERWKEYDALSVRETCADEPADGAVEKILVLIELHDVIAWGGVRHHSIPGHILSRFSRFGHVHTSICSVGLVKYSGVPKAQRLSPSVRNGVESRCGPALA